MMSDVIEDEANGREIRQIRRARLAATDDWCDDCHGYTHMPYCPSYQQLSYEQSASAIEGEPRSGMYGTCLRCFNDGWDAHKRGLHPANFHAGFAVPGIPHSCQTGEQLQYLGNRAEELSSLLAGMTTERDEIREAIERFRARAVEMALQRAAVATTVEAAIEAAEISQLIESLPLVETEEK